MGWTPTGTGHELTIQDGRIVARNAKGRILVNVPAKVKKTEAYEQLDDLLIFLADHDAEVGEQVERCAPPAHARPASSCSTSTCPA